jgi:hypothetical protein
MGFFRIISVAMIVLSRWVSSLAADQVTCGGENLGIRRH